MKLPHVSVFKLCAHVGHSYLSRARNYAFQRIRMRGVFGSLHCGAHLAVFCAVHGRTSSTGWSCWPEGNPEHKTRKCRLPSLCVFPGWFLVLSLRKETKKLSQDSFLTLMGYRNKYLKRSVWLCAMKQTTHYRFLTNVLILPACPIFYV